MSGTILLKDYLHRWKVRSMRAFSKREKIKAVILYLLITLNLLFGYGILTAIAPRINDSTIWTILQSITLAITLLFWGGDFLDSVQMFFKDLKSILKMVENLLFMALFFNFAASVICSLFVNVQETEIVFPSLWGRICYLFVGAFFAPITEELSMRFGMFNAIYPHHRKLAYIITAFLFGLNHIWSAIFSGNVSGMILIIPPIIFGLFACRIYEKSQNICCSILLHMINNGISILLTVICP
ncbi:MAG: CPBP family intramembrane metalloprotease [Clostridiales bacterium]|nr:CPBP family intramembrane metalloprotease [Candidatus Cacconaster stercorequi]